jgi:hypothetical protein
MKWADFPVGMRALLVAVALLFGIEFIIFSAVIIGSPWKVDPGVATLLGAVGGLAIVAWQARIGFANLIRSQENQARLEQRGREHQQQLDQEKIEREIAREKKILLSAIRPK